MNIDTSGLFWLLNAWNIFCNPFTFKFFMSLDRSIANSSTECKHLHSDKDDIAILSSQNFYTGSTLQIGLPATNMLWVELAQSKSYLPESVLMQATPPPARLLKSLLNDWNKV